MHPAILNATGYTLLLSGLVTLVMLLREGCKRKRRSPFYILSTSDVFSSIVTATALLASHVAAGVKYSYNWQNSAELDRTWAIKDYDGKLLFPRAHQLSRETAHGVDSNVTLTCDVKDVFMQYGMLLAPLTNALISLLTFAVQCNLNAACVKQKCANAMASSASDARLGTKQRRGRATPEDQQELASQLSNVSAKNASIVRRIMKMFQFQTRQGDKRPASFLVTSHWLVPFLVTAILGFAGYDDMNTVQRMEDTECMLESNFPVNFYVFPGAQDNVKIVNSSVNTASLENYYFVDEEMSSKSNLSNVEVNRIISKVQSIVRNVLSYIRDSTEGTKITNLDTSRLQNMTDYVAMNNTSHIENVTSIDKVGETLTINDTTERIVNVYNMSDNQADAHTYFNKDSEMLLFHSLLKNASGESDSTTLDNSSNVMQAPVQDKNGSYEEDTRTYLAGTEDATQQTVDLPITQDPTLISNNQIYANILKRIQTASTYTALKSHNRSLDRFYGKKQRSDLEGQIAKIKPDSIADLFLREYDHVNVGTNYSPYMINECLVSNQFLKLYLFVLSFTIYFLPILLCCILQVRGEHACESTLAILKAKLDLMSALFHENSDDDDNVVIVNENAYTKWSSTSNGSGGCQNLTDRFKKSIEIRDHSSTTDVGTLSKNQESCVEAQNRDMLLEVNCTARICGVVKVLLILCVLLWSPIFLGTLLRVFSCIQAPQWLTDTIFLSAVSFGIIRNILNIYIIKIQELCSNDNAKENRIHPVE